MDPDVGGDLDDIIARFGESDDDDKDDFGVGGARSTFVFLDDEAPSSSVPLQHDSPRVDMRALPITTGDSGDEGGHSSDSGSFV